MLVMGRYCSHSYENFSEFDRTDVPRIEGEEEGWSRDSVLFVLVGTLENPLYSAVPDWITRQTGQTTALRTV